MGGYQQASCVCPHCKNDARFVNRRAKNFTSLVGQLRIKRCYYHCPECHQGYLPWDEELGVNHSANLTPAAREVVSLAGIQSSFAQASERMLKIMSGVRLSESTVERVTEATGEQVGEHLRAKKTFGPSRAWQWHQDARGQTCAYVSLDATGIRQQGPKGARAEGRMAYVGMIYNPRESGEPEERRRESTPHEVRYLAGYYELSELDVQLRKQAAQVGWDEVEQQIAISDGGAGLGEFFRVNFPRAECILDSWHAKEHLRELSQAWFGELNVEGSRWLDEQCHRLKHEGGAAVLAELERMDLSSRSAWVAVAS